MIKNFLKALCHILLALLLTTITQIGGLVYVLTLLLIKRKRVKYKLKRVLCFSILYTVCTFFVVPPLAKVYGRERVQQSQVVRPHSIFYILANRNYVTPALNSVLEQSALDIQQKYPGIKLVYLDANFPFIDGFPLLPHLSHNDGKKIDLSFVYKDSFGNMTNLKPSRSGYGIYEMPKTAEFDQTASCKSKGYWQYDFPKYITLGTSNKNLVISEEGTSALTWSLLKQSLVSKLFIEPHLKARMQLYHKKVRFHGCQAVSHDDHIHVQVK